MHLTQGFTTLNSSISSTLSSGEIHKTPIRHYIPHLNSEDGQRERDKFPVVIYYHGGGLYVGDLDSEDLTCRRICKTLHCNVYSVEYRLMTEYLADDALEDALNAFQEIVKKGSREGKKIEVIIVGSSSGGQLAAQVSQHFQNIKEFGSKVKGVLLRGPVTCNATKGGIHLPHKFRELHHSMSPAFHTSLLSDAVLIEENRTKTALPLEVEDLRGMPKHWIQVSTNDIYYSDGVCYAEALKEQGVDVRVDIIGGWPHTFWLKAPELERAIEAESDMLEGLAWLMES